jgi:hypothetical protein
MRRTTAPSDGWRLAEAACVDPRQVHILWPHVSHLVRRAMERGRMGRFEDVQRDVLAGNAYLWAATEDGKILAVAVTQIGRDTKGRLCTIVACGGAGWRRFGHLIEVLENYARDEACGAIEVCGRPGWARLLNYRTTRVVLRKELD